MQSKHTKHTKYTRFNTPGEAHGLSFSCYKKRRFLNNDRTRNYLVESINKARMKHKFDVWAYVIMPEHVHLLIFPSREVYSISDILKSIKLPVARKSISYLESYGSGIIRLLETGLESPKYRFWQDGGGYDRNISNHGELIRLVDYIHDNPVTMGLCGSSVDWFWSSARDWLTGVDGAIKIDRETFPFS